MNVQEAAKSCGVHPSVVSAAILRGILTGEKIPSTRGAYGWRWDVSAADVCAWRKGIPVRHAGVEFPLVHDMRVHPLPESGCWIWTGTREPTGYGVCQFGGRKWLAHRLSVMLARGPIPDGMFVDHVCRERSCVNPDHLRVVTPRVNALENNDSCYAINARMTHCSVCGGDFDIRMRDGRRRCRKCVKRRTDEYRTRKRVGR